MNAHIDCLINRTECDENCLYYSKILLKCPLKVEGNGIKVSRMINKKVTQKGK